MMKYPKVWHCCLNFRKITAKFSGVRNLRNFTVQILLENPESLDTQNVALSILKFKHISLAVEKYVLSIKRRI